MHGTVLPSSPATPTGLSGCTRSPRARGPPMEPAPSPQGSGAPQPPARRPRAPMSCRSIARHRRSRSTRSSSRRDDLQGEKVRVDLRAHLQGGLLGLSHATTVRSEEQRACAARVRACLRGVLPFWLCCGRGCCRDVPASCRRRSVPSSRSLFLAGAGPRTRSRGGRS